MNKQKSDLGNMAYLVGRHISKYWKQTILLICLSVSGATLSGLQAILLAPAIEFSLPSKVSPASSLSDVNLNNIGATLLAQISPSVADNVLVLIFIIVGIFFTVGIVAALVEFSAHMLSGWINIHSYADLQYELYSHLMNLDYNFYLKNRVSEITSRFINDAGEVTVSLDVSMRQALESTFQILFYGYLLFKTSGSLAIAVLVASFIHFLINRILRGRIKLSTSDKFDKLAEAGSIISESLSNIKVIKCFSAEKYTKHKVQQILDVFRVVSMRFSLYKHTETPLRKITDSFLLGVILLLSFRSMHLQELSTTGFLLFMIVVRQTIAPISTLAQSFIRLHAGLGSARRVLELLNARSDQKEGLVELNGLKEGIEFKNVTFGFGDERPVLRNINFQLRRGEVLAVVGPSGAGKSTLADLLVRLFDPREGNILVDGIPANTFTTASYRRLFGVVPQESLLSHLTIEENIAFGKKGGVFKDLQRAAEISSCNGFINKLPDKYQTYIGDRGIRLSGGQRQRLAIARAIYVNPEVLVLDEATSALDSETERRVHIAISELLNGSTAFIIAHRLATIRQADRILVLNNGEIEAIGTADDLMRISPTFRKMYELQFGMERRI